MVTIFVGMVSLYRTKYVRARVQEKGRGMDEWINIRDNKGIEGTIRPSLVRL